MAKFIDETEATKNKWTRWVQPLRTNYKMACCDCGLVHDMEFRIYKGKIQFRVRRNKRSTAQMRRHNKIEFIHD